MLHFQELFDTNSKTQKDQHTLHMELAALNSHLSEESSEHFIAKLSPAHFASMLLYRIQLVGQLYKLTDMRAEQATLKLELKYLFLVKRISDYFYGEIICEELSTPCLQVHHAQSKQANTQFSNIPSGIMLLPPMSIAAKGTEAWTDGFFDEVTYLMKQVKAHKEDALSAHLLLMIARHYLMLHLSASTPQNRIDLELSIATALDKASRCLPPSGYYYNLQSAIIRLSSFNTATLPTALSLFGTEMFMPISTIAAEDKEIPGLEICQQFQALDFIANARFAQAKDQTTLDALDAAISFYEIKAGQPLHRPPLKPVWLENQHNKEYKVLKKLKKECENILHPKRVRFSSHLYERHERSGLMQACSAATITPKWNKDRKNNRRVKRMPVKSFDVKDLTEPERTSVFKMPFGFQ